MGVHSWGRPAGGPKRPACTSGSSGLQNRSLHNKLLLPAGHSGALPVPPLEALRVLLSEAATVEEGCGEKVLEIDDVSRAFFEAPAVRNVCVEIPKEDMSEADIDK